MSNYKQNTGHKGRSLIPTIDYVASNTSDGNSFHLSDKIQIPLNEQFIIAITTNHDVIEMIGWSFKCDVDGIDALFYEESDITAGTGTEISARCRNRRDSVPCQTNFILNPTVVDEGNLLMYTGILDAGGSGPQLRTERPASDPRTWILDGDTTYIWELDNISGGVANILYSLDFIVRR